MAKGRSLINNEEIYNGENIYFIKKELSVDDKEFLRQQKDVIKVFVKSIESIVNVQDKWIELEKKRLESLARETAEDRKEKRKNVNKVLIVMLVIVIISTVGSAIAPDSGFFKECLKQLQAWGEILLPVVF